MELISLAQYAKDHGRNPDTVKQKAQRGGFNTARKIGRNWVIDKDEPYIDRREKKLTMSDVLTKEARESLTPDERRSILKTEQAKDYSGLRAYPSTCAAVMQRIPDDMWERYNAKQLGEIMRIVHDAYDAGKIDGQANR